MYNMRRCMEMKSSHWDFCKPMASPSMISSESSWSEIIFVAREKGQKILKLQLCMNLEKRPWFHPLLVFEVIPGTGCCTLIKCLWCVDHTCRGVCSIRLARGATVSSGWLRVPRTTCHSAVYSNFLTRPGSSVQQTIFYPEHSLPPLSRITLDFCVRTAKSIFRAAFWWRGR